MVVSVPGVIWVHDKSKMCYRSSRPKFTGQPCWAHMIGDLARLAGTLAPNHAGNHTNIKQIRFFYSCKTPEAPWHDMRDRGPGALPRNMWEERGHRRSET